MATPASIQRVCLFVYLFVLSDDIRNRIKNRSVFYGRLFEVLIFDQFIFFCTAIGHVLFRSSPPPPSYGVEDFRATVCVRGCFLLADHGRVVCKFSRCFESGSIATKLVQET